MLKKIEIYIKVIKIKCNSKMMQMLGYALLVILALSTPAAFHGFTMMEAGEGYFVSAGSEATLTISCP